jgi:hypothetical protein
MHPSTEELLSIRDGDQVPADVTGHLEYCESCQNRLGRLNLVRAELRGLAELSPPEGAWQRIEAQVELGTRRESRTDWRWLGLAASILLVAVTVALLGDRQPATESPAELAASGRPAAAGGESAAAQAGPAAVAAIPSPGVTVVPAAAVASAAGGMGLPALGELVARSQRLEQTLRALPRGPVVVSAGTAGTIAELQDRIALVDYRLNAGFDEGPGDELETERARRLWQERVELMNTLLAVRYAQAQQVSF